MLPPQVQVQEFDDVIVSLMALTGWAALLYFCRGVQVGCDGPWD